MSDFMQLQTTEKGRLVSCECAKCGATIYAHEWASLDFNGERNAMQDGRMRCQECAGAGDPDTFWESPSRNYYACRYSAPGYLDCTDWSFGKNRRALEREVRDMYGSDY